MVAGRTETKQYGGAARRVYIRTMLRGMSSDRSFRNSVITSIVKRPHGFGVWAVDEVGPRLNTPEDERGRVCWERVPVDGGRRVVDLVGDKRGLSVYRVRTRRPSDRTSHATWGHGGSKRQRSCRLTG